MLFIQSFIDIAFLIKIGRFDIFWRQFNIRNTTILTIVTIIIVTLNAIVDRAHRQETMIISTLLWIGVAWMILLREIPLLLMPGHFGHLTRLRLVSYQTSAFIVQSEVSFQEITLSRKYVYALQFQPNPAMIGRVYNVLIHPTNSYLALPIYDDCPKYLTDIRHHLSEDNAKLL